MKMVPGDVAQVIAGLDGTAEDVELIRESLGLDQPLYDQYLTLPLALAPGLISAARRSRSGRSLEEIASRDLADRRACGGCVGLSRSWSGWSPASISATSRYTIWDNLATLIALIGVSMPVFWLGLMMMLLFSVTLGWLPSSGAGTRRSSCCRPWRSARPRPPSSPARPGPGCSRCSARTTCGRRAPRGSTERVVLLPPCAQERADPDRHRGRPPGRLPDGRGRPGRDRLRAAGPRAAAGGLDRAPRHPGGPDDHHAALGDVRAGEPVVDLLYVKLDPRIRYD